MNYASRKFVLASVAMAASIYGLMADKIDGNGWFLSIGVILGLYGAANVAEGKNAKTD